MWSSSAVILWWQGAFSAEKWLKMCNDRCLVWVFRIIEAPVHTHLCISERLQVRRLHQKLRTHLILTHTHKHLTICRQSNNHDLATLSHPMVLHHHTTRLIARRHHNHTLPRPRNSLIHRGNKARTMILRDSSLGLLILLRTRTRLLTKAVDTTGIEFYRGTNKLLCYCSYFFLFSVSTWWISISFTCFLNELEVLFNNDSNSLNIQNIDNVISVV